MAEHVNNEPINVEAPISTDFSQSDQSSNNISEMSDGAASKGRAKIWLDVLVMILMFLLSQALGGGLAVLFGVEYPDESMLQSFDVDVKEDTSFMQARFVAVSYFISMVICLAMLWGYKRLRHLPFTLEFRMPGWAAPFRLLWGYCLLWIFTIALEPLTELLPGNQDSVGQGGWLLVSAVLLAPVFEEILFRGYIAGFVRKTYGAVVAWLVSALLFALVHGIPSVVVSALFAGLVLSFYYLRYRSLVMVILLHAMNNVTACFLNTINMSDMTLHEILGGGAIYWSIYGFALVVTIIVLIRMCRVLQMAKK